MRKFWIAAAIISMSCLVLIVGLWVGAAYHAQIASTLGSIGTMAEGNHSIHAEATKQFYTCSMHPQVILDHPGKCPICQMELQPMRADATTAGGPSKERKILYWTDPMYNPPYISDKPGKSPMGMELIPVYEDQVSGGPAITIDPVIVQNMGMRVAKVSQGPLRTTLRMVGTLVEPEQNHIEINLRISGWIQKLYANQDGMAVQKGDKLFDLYSLDLTAAADELINARKASDAMNAATDSVARSATSTMLAAAKRKLELLGLTTDDVEAISKMDKAPATVTFTSPMTGHVVEKAVVEGSSVKAGDRVMRIADRSTMWLQVQIYEHQLPLVSVGTPVQAQINGVPGKTFEGKVEFIYPHLDMMTRTAMARITLVNEGHNLHEGMYATVMIDSEVASNTLLVPREAVIDSGTRQIVFVAQDGGHFEPRKVTIGQNGHSEGTDSGDDMVQILTGLTGNDTVVTSGQFLLDSESRMQEAIQKHLRERLIVADTLATMPAMMTTSDAPAATMPATAPADIPASEKMP